MLLATSKTMDWELFAAECQADSKARRHQANNSRPTEDRKANRA